MARTRSPRKSLRSSTRAARKPTFSTSFGAQGFRIDGRAPFGGVAKRIRVNQDPGKGRVEDRRHILHYDEVLKPAIERVVNALYVDEGRHGDRVAQRILKALHKRGIRRLPRRGDKVMERLVIEINSAPMNLVPDRADTNKAIEVVRGYLRKYIQQLQTEAFAQACVEGDVRQMAAYRRQAREVFVLTADGGDITAERNRMHRMIIEYIDGCASPSALWGLIHELVHTATFDFSPKITRDATAKAIAWQKKMQLMEGRPPQEQLEALLGLLD